MGKNLTKADVARHAGVSPTTVSYVLNRRADVSIPEHTRERVFKAAKELGYQPNLAARALATGQTNLMALYTSNLKSSFFGDIITHVTRQMGLNDYQMLHFEDTGQLSNELNRSWLHTGMVDGIMVYDGIYWLPKFIKNGAKANIPIVSMGSYNVEGTDLVAVDFVQAFKDALTHLVKSGCKNVLYVVNEWANHTGDARHDAYTEIMHEFGLPANYLPILDEPLIMRQDARKMIKEYVSSKGVPDGILCMSDIIEIGVFRGLRDIGIRVPDDVLLIGCDGIEDTEYTDPQLSTIVIPTRQISVIACEYMCNRLNDPSMPLQKTVLYPQFEPRQSSQR